MSTEAGTGSQQSQATGEHEPSQAQGTQTRGSLSVQPESWSARPWIWAVLGAVFVAVFLALPSAPNYDTATHLVWGKSLAGGSLPTIDYLSAPTPHPLWLLLASIGSVAVMELVALAGLTLIAVLVWRLAEDLGGVIAGVIAALAALSSFALLLLTFKAYVDVPFVALVLLALVWERQWRPGDAGGLRRPEFAVPAVLLAAGLLRPEAWAFGLLLVGSRLVRGGSLRELLAPSSVVLAAPVIWVLFDWALTGNAFHSLTGTRELAEELGRPTGLARAPRELVVLLGDLARPPVAAAGVLGIGLLAVRGRWREPRAGLPLLLFAAACAGFLLVGALSLPLLQRYLLIASVLMAVFAGVGLAVLAAVAFSKPDPLGGSEAAASPALRAAAIAVLAVGVLGGAGYLVLKAGSFETVARGALREATWQRQAVELVNEPAVVQASKCGRVTLPTYRLVPEINRTEPQIAQPVVSRATTLGGAGPQDAGVAIVIDGDRKALTRLAYAAGVKRTTNTAPPGFNEIARRGPFVAYARCES